MGMSTAGLNFLGKVMAENSVLGLGNSASAPLAPGVKNYAHVPCKWGAGDEDEAGFTATGGVLTNANTFYFPEADDETGATNDGWGSVSHLFFLDKNTTSTQYYVGALNPAVTVSQDVQLRFSAGAIRITFTCVTVTS